MRTQVQTAPHASNNKESSETEEHEKCGHASYFLLQVIYPWSCTCSGSLPKKASSISLTRFRMSIRFGLHRKQRPLDVEMAHGSAYQFVPFARQEPVVEHESSSPRCGLHRCKSCGKSELKGRLYLLLPISVRSSITMTIPVYFW